MPTGPPRRRRAPAGPALPPPPRAVVPPRWRHEQRRPLRLASTTRSTGRTLGSRSLLTPPLVFVARDTRSPESRLFATILAQWSDLRCFPDFRPKISSLEGDEPRRRRPNPRPSSRVSITSRACEKRCFESTTSVATPLWPSAACVQEPDTGETSAVVPLGIVTPRSRSTSAPDPGGHIDADSTGPRSAPRRHGGLA